MRTKDKEFVETVKAPELEHTDEDYEYDENGDYVLKKYKGALVRNPNGANKGIQDPRAELAWRYYVNSIARGEPNAKKAALQAGYSTAFAPNIVNCKWFKERKAKLKRKNMLTRAEKNLSKILNLSWSSMKLVGEEMVEEVDIDKVKVVKDVSIFLAETLGKDEGYSKKIQEEKNVSHDIKIESVSYADAVEIPAEAQEVIKEAVINEIENG